MKLYIGPPLAGAVSPVADDVTDRSARKLGQVQLVDNFFSNAINGNSDASDFGTGGVELWVRANMALLNKANSSIEHQRTPTTSKSGSGTSSITIWTPAAGKKFRLMYGILGLTSRAAMAAATDATVAFFDSGAGANIAGTVYVVTVPAASGPTGPPLLLAMFALPGNGYLSAAANGQLQVTLPTLTAGVGFAAAWGTEE